MKVTEMRGAPFSRATFERNLFLFHEELVGGRVHFAHTIRVDGFLRVRYLPNGRIDLLSVDDSTRLQANTIVYMGQLPPAVDPEK